MNMNVDNNIVRGKFTFSSRNKSRESSILLNTSSMVYYEWIEVMNNILSNEAQAPVDSWQLLYASNYPEVEKGE